MKFIRQEQLRFKHCDTAGIVFYPRFFELANDLVEDWFEELGLPFSVMHQEEHNMGVPVVHIDCNFSQPGFLGERINKELVMLKIGATSCQLVISFISQETNAVLLSMEITLVCIYLHEKKSRPWGKELRASMMHYKSVQEAKAHKRL